MSLVVTVSAEDNNGTSLFRYSVPFEAGMNVRRVMEVAFILNQQPQPNADPFLYALEYYGYSYDPQFPGYLGYEIEGIGNKKILPNTTQFYWELEIDGRPSSSGADTTYPAPGSSVSWKYSAIPSDPKVLTPRTRVIHSLRKARRSAQAAGAD